MATPTPKKSWRTTLYGILTFVGSLIPSALPLIDGNPETVIDTAEICAAFMGLMTGLGFISARDNKVSSEDAGAK